MLFVRVDQDVVEGVSGKEKSMRTLVSVEPALFFCSISQLAKLHPQIAHNNR